MLTVTDVRVTNQTNTKVTCECGKSKWVTWSVAKSSYSCGCTRKPAVKGERFIVNTSAESYKMRANGTCFKNGVCKYYRECGDRLFECSCRGYEEPKRLYLAQDGCSAIVHGGVL